MHVALHRVRGAGDPGHLDDHARLNPTTGVVGSLLDNPILFTSREFDVETGLYYNRARYLDPTTGRWTTQDPLGFAAGDANLYRYVGNMATMATDPSGNIFFVPFVVGALLVGGGSVGLHIAANRYDHASSILARPPSPENDAEFRRVYNQARWIHASSNVAVVSGGAMMVSPGIGYAAGWIAQTGTVGTVAVYTAGAGLIAGGVCEVYAICRDWDSMADDAERFERVGTLLGPLAAGLYPGYVGFIAGRAAGRAFVARAHAPQAVVENLNPANIRFSQNTAGGRGRADVLRQSMRERGWAGDPVDAVRTPDGITTIDNTRVAVARELGIQEIPVRVHAPTEPLPPGMIATRRFGDARTWGEALAHRTANQRPPLPPTGTPDAPRMPRLQN